MSLSDTVYIFLSACECLSVSFVYLYNCFSSVCFLQFLPLSVFAGVLILFVHLKYSLLLLPFLSVLFICVIDLVCLFVSLALCIPLSYCPKLPHCKQPRHRLSVCFTFFSSHNHQPSRISLLCFSLHILTSPPLCPSSWSKLTQLHVSHKKRDKKYWVRYQHPRIDLSCRKQIHDAILITPSL